MTQHKTRFKKLGGVSVAAVLALTAVALLYTPAFSSEQPASSDSGTVEIVLSSDLPNLTRGLSVYSLSGARFGVYGDYQCSECLGELATDENGHGVSPALSAGRYFIRQTQASPGYALSDHLYQADVAIGKSTTILATQTPCYATPSTLLVESNAETGTCCGVAGAKLEGGEYALMYYDTDKSATPLGTPTRTWTVTCDASGKALYSEEYLSGGSPLFTGPQDRPVLPLGLYVVSTVKAPTGFMPTETSLTREVRIDAAQQTNAVCDFEPLAINLQIIRGDVAFRKVDGNNRPLAGIPFLLSFDNGSDPVESHIIVTNDKGDYSSDAAYIPHSINTNASDAAAVPNADGTFAIADDKIASSAGTWFSLDQSGKTCPATDTVGALPYGSYVLQELGCNANRGMNLATVRFSVYRDAYTVSLDNIVDTVPGIAGCTFDAKDANKLIAPNSNSTIIDKVGYANLIVGKEYTLTCVPLLKSTGEQLQDAAGAPAVFSKTFSPLEKDGEIDASIDIDTASHAGDQILVYEQLTSADGMTISNTDENVASNTLEIEPIITSSAYDQADHDKYIRGTDAVITEHIAYDGLKTGTSYTLECMLVDKATGNTIRDAQGKNVSARATFAPDSAQGVSELSLPVDASAIAGHDLVVFNTLNDAASALVASSQDMENAAQTVKTVKLSSNATDALDADKRFDSKSAEVNITDTVEYANLEPQQAYEVHGVLMDKETGTALQVSGAPVTGSAKFVAQEVSDSVAVKFSFDASAQTSDVLVAFETLEHEGNVIAQHADLEDVAQTVTSEEIIPESEIAAALDAGAQQMATTGTVGKSPSVSTKDQIGATLITALIMLMAAGACIGIAAHHRKRALDRPADTKRS